MLITLLAITLITVGGASLSYLVSKDGPLMWRLAAGNVVGSAIFGLAVFLAACFFGLTTGVVIGSLAVTLLPLAVFSGKTNRRGLRHDLDRARGKLEGATGKKLLSACYYLGILLLLYFFFDRAMIEAKDGVYTGVAHNLGDLHFHLGAIFSFTDGQNFPPENPSYAGAKFTYPFMADLVAAAFVRLGTGARQAMFWQNVTLGFSLVVLLEAFTVRLTRSKLAGKIAPLLLLFSGGFGFVLFFKDLIKEAGSLSHFIWHLPIDYTIRFDGGLRWGNALITLLITQRSLLFGMPLTLLVLDKLWQIFSAGDKGEGDVETVSADSRASGFSAGVLITGLLAGSLVLIHLHSLAVLFIVGVCLFAFAPGKWKMWLTFAVGVAVVALPELWWVMSGSATDTSKFFGWHFGWDKGEWNFFTFWFVNAGLFIPLLLVTVALIYTDNRKKDGQGLLSLENGRKLLLFYTPFALCFIIPNLVKLAPWEWDNIKVLIYWFVGSAPLVALLLARGWELGNWQRAVAGMALAILIFAGALDVWHAVSGAQYYRVSDKDAVKIADDIGRLTEPRSLFLNAPIYNSPMALTGRRSLMRYSGHLSSYGIDYAPREEDVRRIYEGGGVADLLLKKYNIDYVLIGPEERETLKANEAYFSRYPVIAEEGAYRVYKIRN